LVAGLSACGTDFLVDGRTQARRAIDEHGFQQAQVKADPFVLYTAFKGLDDADTRLTVYIEGDGRSWTNRYSPPIDPTPANPIALDLAVRDEAPRVVYIARPCQYTRDRDRRGCHPRYWATHRFAEEVIDATNQVVDHYKAAFAVREIELVGFSGGGAVAALIAARRSDVVGLTTLGAPLDHATWTRIHGVTPMTNSLNPADQARDLQDVPQVHLVGADDSTVPAEVVRAYQARMSDPSMTRIIVLENHDHTCCWVENWRSLRTRTEAR
jgi:dienelactone hydrolase